MSGKKSRKQGRAGTGRAGRPAEPEKGRKNAPIFDLPRRRLFSPKVEWGLWAAALMLLCIFFLILKSFSLHPYAGDEFIYLFQGKLVSEGFRPYADFAMAHPPLQSLFTALIFKLFGEHFTLMRLFPVFWCLLGGIALAVTVRRELGGIASFFAATLFLTAHEPLRASSHFTGVNMTVALMIFTMLAYRTGRIRTAAALATAAVFTRLYAIPGVAALVVFALLSDKKQGRALIFYGGVFGAAVFVIFGLWTGFSDMVNNIFLYHADKTPMSEASLAAMRDSVLFHNATSAALFALSLPMLFFALAQGYKRAKHLSGIFEKLRFAVNPNPPMPASKLASGDGASLFSPRNIKKSNMLASPNDTSSPEKGVFRLGLPIVGALTAATFLLVLLNMNRVWMYYYIPAFPFAAIASGWMISVVLRGAARWILAKGRASAAGLSAHKILGGAGLVALFVLSFIFSPRLEARLAYFEKASNPASKNHIRRYTFVPSPLPDAINDFVRNCLWKDERVIGEPHNSINYYLWHESRVLDIADKVVSVIQKETSSTDNIFGDSGTVPLFALLSGRGIAGNEVDTNIQRYRSGNADPKELISRIDNYKTKVIILRRRFGVFGVPEVQELVKTKYRRVMQIRSAQGKVFQIFKRKADLSDLKES